MTTEVRAGASNRDPIPYPEDASRKPDTYVPSEPLNPCELEIDLFCKGIRVDASCTLGEVGRPLVRTRAGLGSGLEMIIPGTLKDVWVNVPVEEPFARKSCYRIVKVGDHFRVVDDREGFSYPVRLSPEVPWYTRTTSSGVPMQRIGVLQGTYLHTRWF